MGIGTRGCRARKQSLMGVLLVFLVAVSSEVVAEVVEEHAFFLNLARVAGERANYKVRYDGAYIRIPYPGGDVPADTGVCTDEIIRSYRGVGIDLQKLVHEDMTKHFGLYPKAWGRRAPDANIDHRRVPNLMTFFRRKGISLRTSRDPKEYKPGDIVAWKLSNGLLHIGIVVEGQSDDGVRPLVMHNIGEGPKKEDALFVGEIIGHYRYGA